VEQRTTNNKSEKRKKSKEDISVYYQSKTVIVKVILNIVGITIAENSDL